MKIAVVTHSPANLTEIDALAQRYDLNLFDRIEAMGACDLAIYDAGIGEQAIFECAMPTWMVINQARIHQSLKFYQAGASGVLGQRYSRETLYDCIEAIQAGGFYIAPEMIQVLAMRQIRRLLSPFSSLSSREFDVFCLLAEGCTIPYIADSLVISSKTAFNCQTQIKNKLGLSDQRQMNRFAKNNGLI